MRLPEAVDAPDPLLDPHRVPRHVVVDQGAAELEVQSLRGGVRAQQQVGLALPEAALDLVAADCAPSAAGGSDLAPAAREAHQAQGARMPVRGLRPVLGRLRQ